jgi:hypothetical protein
LWDPESSFLYRGLVELYEGGQLVDQAALTHGLRRLQLMRGGLWVNGKRWPLCGREGAIATDAEGLGLRHAGYNLLVVERDAPDELWELADRLGFLVLARGFAWKTMFRASYLGLLIRAEDWGEGLLHLKAILPRPGRRTGRLPPEGGPFLAGVEWRASPAHPNQESASFLVCPPELAGAAQHTGLPYLVRGKAPQAALMGVIEPAHGGEV